MKKQEKFILWFSEISKKDLLLVGGKNAALGEMYQKLRDLGIDVPYGFAISASAYRYFLKFNNLTPALKKIIRGVNKQNLSTKGAKIRKMFLAAPLPPELAKEIRVAYRRFEKIYGRNIDVAVRSSATAEDLPTASFAGQQESFLNIRGEKQLLWAVRCCFASLFTDRAISYREDFGFNHLRVFLSVGVQKMVRSDKGSAGVAFTLDTETGFDKVVIINGSFGLGENVVQGKIESDEFIVFKPTKKIISKKLGSKKYTSVYAKGRLTRNQKTPERLRNQFCLPDRLILRLASWCLAIEKHFGGPMDIEWAAEPLKAGGLRLFILQARPETVFRPQKHDFIERYNLQKRSKIIAHGISIGAKIGRGSARIVLDPKDIKKFRKGEVLVTEMTNPDFGPAMKKAAAIVTNQGGRTSHAAIVSRELGIPCVVGTNIATKKIKNGQKITVSAAEGAVGKIYQGLLPIKIERIEVAKILSRLRSRKRTKIMVNIGDPDQAFGLSLLPCDGVGLARIEFIFTNSIKIHPLALIDFDKIKDRKLKTKIKEISRGWEDKEKFFIENLAFGIAKIAAAFWPKPVIVRFSDLKTNEYKGLIGGELYEPNEENPMIGFRGASRYLDKNYSKAFRLECRAMNLVRTGFGLTNIKLMIPFCRTVEESEKVLGVLKQERLIRGKKGLEILVMCEIPSNVILAKDFFNLFDGMSIGSNDLTQLILGIDRDNPRLANIFDEQNKAVILSFRQVISLARKMKKEIGICGQAPSDFPELARFLLRQGISSISLNPDTIVKAIYELFGQI